MPLRAQPSVSDARALEAEGLGSEIAQQVNRTLSGYLEHIRERIRESMSAEMDQFRERIRERMVAIGGPPPVLATIPTAATVPPTLHEHRGQITTEFQDQAETLRITRATRRAHIAPVNRHTDMPNDTTYELIVQQYCARAVQYGHGVHNRWPRSRFAPPYIPAREIPLSCQDACRCAHLYYEIAPYRLRSLHFDDLMQDYDRDLRRRLRRQALGEAGFFSTTPDRALVELRQARALAGIDVSEYDVEITRRILADPSAWGQVGSVMRRRGWVDEVLNDGENYVLH